MNIVEHLHRIEEKLNFIIEASGLEESQKNTDNPNQLNFPWFEDSNQSEEPNTL